jgi:hypothetical protein
MGPKFAATKFCSIPQIIFVVYHKFLWSMICGIPQNFCGFYHKLYHKILWYKCLPQKKSPNFTKKSKIDVVAVGSLIFSLWTRSQQVRPNTPQTSDTTTLTHHRGGYPSPSPAYIIPSHYKFKRMQKEQ